MPIRGADRKTLVDVTHEIRAEQAAEPRIVAGQRWMESVPVILTPLVFGIASRSIGWALKFGVAGVNNVGVGQLTGWGLAPGAGTIGGIESRPSSDGTIRRIAHLTLSFDHDVVDGAPAARFAARLLEHHAAGQIA